MVRVAHGVDRKRSVGTWRRRRSVANAMCFSMIGRSGPVAVLFGVADGVFNGK
jgi:hypothetical protein